LRSKNSRNKNGRDAIFNPRKGVKRKSRRICNGQIRGIGAESPVLPRSGRMRPNYPDYKVKTAEKGPPGIYQGKQYLLLWHKEFMLLGSFLNTFFGRENT
jgi:hypothetical protein